MQTTAIKSVLTALFVVCSLTGHAQVYSIHVGSIVGGGKLVYQLDHDWTIGRPPNRFGLVQFRKSNEGSDALITYTRVHFLSGQYTVEMPALAIAAIGVLAPSSLVLLIIAARRKAWEHQREQPHAA